MHTRRFGRLIAALYCGLLVLLFVSGQHLLQSRNAAFASVQNALDCQRLADQIEAIKSAPAQASLEERTQQDLAQKIEQAAQIADIHNSAVANIHPQTGHRMGKSPLVAQPTSIQLRDISLKQLTRLLTELAADESGLEATSLRLTAPRNVPPSEAEERWSVELVLTYLVFSPEYSPAHSGSSERAPLK